jgi:hypothetical protein
MACENALGNEVCQVPYGGGSSCGSGLLVFWIGDATVLFDEDNDLVLPLVETQFGDHLLRQPVASDRGD